MHHEIRDVSPEVIAAHEAGHAIAVIVFGGTFTGIRVTRDGGAAAQTLQVGGLTDLGYARSFLAGTAGEEVALGTSDPRNAQMDHSLMLQAISDYTVLAHASTRATELIVKYRTAHDAVRQLILEELANGTTEVITAERVVALAEAHGAARGAEEPGPSEHS